MPNSITPIILTQTQPSSNACADKTQANDDLHQSRVPKDKSNQLKITECFLSLQGEAAHTGLNTVFVRLTGCPLRCTYCDSEYAFFGGQWYSLDEIEHTVEDFGVPRVCVTGGEPLAQRNCKTLLTRLCDNNYQVSLETSGALDIAEVDARVHIVMDIKTPDSGEVKRNKLSNLQHLKPSDEIKFIISSEADYEWSKQFLVEHALYSRGNLLFSPDYERLEPQTLADWIVRDRLAVRFQIQLHKYLWGDKEGV